MRPFLSAFLSARLVDRADGHRRAVLQRFADDVRHDFYSRALRDEMQGERLAGLLQHARAHVPAFRDALASAGDITPANARQVLRRLPVLRRADVQAAPARYLADDAAGAADDFTGGSTGTPLAFKVDAETQRGREASLYWANSLAGWRYGERVAMLWGSDRDVSASRRDRRLDLRWRIENMRWFNAFQMGDAEMERFHRELSRFRPHLVVAYAGSIAALAAFVEARGWRPAYPLAGVVSSAEVLTPAMRDAVERVFRRPVFDRYGNREAGAIAAECVAHQGLHVNEADFVVEIDSPSPQKIPGPILITYLRNRAMPLIRYDTGDLGCWAAPGPCTCGRTTARIAAVVGRQSDNIRTASGKVIHGEYFTHVLYGAKGVREFQFVQDTPRAYRLLIVGDEPDPEQQAAWRRKILDVLGPDSELRIERVAAIPTLPSGKRRFTLSRVGEGA